MNTHTSTEGAIANILEAQVLCLDTNWGAGDDLSCSTIQFLNRPFLHHVVERLAERGIKRIQFVCESNLNAYSRLLGNGERWGLSFQFMFHHSNGYAGLAGDSRVQQVPQSGILSLASHSFPLWTTTDPAQRMIRVDSPNDFIESQAAVMRNQMERHLTIERNLGGQVWVGRNVRIHGSAKIRGPVLIGDNSRIGPGVHLDPCSVIGPNCVIGRNSRIQKSAVMQGLYVGESLEIRNSIVFPEKIVNVHFDTTIPVNDHLLVSRI